MWKISAAKYCGNVFSKRGFCAVLSCSISPVNQTSSFVTVMLTCTCSQMVLFLLSIYSSSDLKSRAGVIHNILWYN